MTRIFVFSLFIMLCFSFSFSQVKEETLIDGVFATVGSHVIFYSDIDAQITQYKNQDVAYNHQNLMESVVEAIKDIGMEGYANMTGSWFNINRKYSSHGNHNHIPDTISGIYYVQADEDDARITFHDQNKVSNWPWRGSINPKFTSRTKSFVPKMGTLYLFPSFVEHSVEQQLKDQERISISFNTFIR